MNIGITLTSSLEVDKAYLDLSEEVASKLAHEGHGIIYGGTSYGMMKKLAEKYKQENGKYLCGVLAKDLISVTKNYEKFPYLDKEYLVDTMEDRKKKIISLSDAYIILPGGYGTFEEIGSIIGGQVNKLYSKPIAFYNFRGFYNSLFQFFDEMYQLQFSRIEQKELFLSSYNLDTILNFFQFYHSKELKDKFV